MDSYEKLRLILDSHPSGAPKSEKFDEILRLLYLHLQLLLMLLHDPPGTHPA